MAAHGFVGGFQRRLRLVQVALRNADEQAVDHGQLPDAAGHGAGAIGGLAHRGGQYPVGDLGDGRAGEVRQRGGSGSAPTGLAQRLDRLDGGAGVRDADGDVAFLQYCGRGQRVVRVGPGEARQADAMQLLLQVQRNERAGSDAVYVDAAGSGDIVDEPLQDHGVQLPRRLLDGLGVGVTDLLDDLPDVVIRGDVAAQLAISGRGAGGVGGQRDAQVRIAADADRLAEPGDSGFAGARGFGDLGDAAPGY